MCGLDQRCLGPGYYWMGDRLRAGKPPGNGFCDTFVALFPSCDGGNFVVKGHRSRSPFLSL